MNNKRNFINLIDARCEQNENAIKFLNSTSTPLGHLTSLKINNQKIIADLNVFNPLEIEKRIDIVGFIRYMAWEGKPHDSVNFTFNMSEISYASFFEALCDSQDLPKIEVEWVIYQYDKSEKKFFKYFYTNSPIALTVMNNSRIGSSSYPDTNCELAPYAFSVGLTAQKDHKDQNLFVSFRSNGKTFSFPIENNQQPTS